MSELKIKVGKKKYDIPDLEVDHWRKFVKTVNSNEGMPVPDIFEDEGIDDSIEFYYSLLHPYYPEVTKKALEKMPVHQLTAPFVQRVIYAIITPPLDSTSEDETPEPNNENPPENS